MSTPRPVDPFGPLEGVVSALLAGLLVVFSLFGVIAIAELALKGSTNVSIATIGDDQTCIPVSNETPIPAVSDIRQRGIDREKATMRVEELDLCLKDSTLWQETLSSLQPVGDLAFAIGGLFLVRRVIRGGRRRGLFVPEVADRVRQLGWFMLAMTFAWPFVVAAGRGVLVQDAVPGRSIAWELLSPDVPVALVVVSLGILSVARVLRRGIALQEDVDATV